MHGEAYGFVAQMVKDFGPFYDVAEIGGRDINGTVRSLFVGAAYTAIDLVDGPGVDLVADAATWQPRYQVDCVVCAEVLEHAANAKEIVLNAFSWLKSPGTLIMTCATDGRLPHSAVTGDLLDDDHDEWYHNVSRDEFEAWCEEAGFVHWETEVNTSHHDLYAVAWR